MADGVQYLLVNSNNLDTQSSFALFGVVEPEMVERKCKPCESVTEKHVLNLSSVNGYAQPKDLKVVYTCKTCGTVTMGS